MKNIKNFTNISSVVIPCSIISAATALSAACIKYNSDDKKTDALYRNSITGTVFAILGTAIQAVFANDMSKQLNTTSAVLVFGGTALSSCSLASMKMDIQNDDKAKSVFNGAIIVMPLMIAISLAAELASMMRESRVV